MEKLHQSCSQWKRKALKTNLTKSKKSKRYREERKYQTPPNIENNSSSAESDSDSNESKSLLWPQNIDALPYYFHPPRDVKDKCIQCSVKSHNSGIQNVPTSRTKCLQTEHRTKNSRGIQTSTEHCVKLTGDNLSSILQSDNVFNLFAEKLLESEQMDKFVQCIKSIASGRFSTTNLAWKSFLDMGCLSNLQLTTQMVYDTEWLEFCQIIYHMFGAGVINALRGHGHFSQVTSNRTLKNKYDPTEGEFNFPIPSIPTLKKLDIGFPAEIPVGFVEQSLQLAEMKSKSGAQFILSFDGKLVAPGCKGDQKGDTDMWGIEGAPNLSMSIKILHKTLALANAINVDVDNSTVKNHFHNLQSLLHVSSLRIKHLWRRITGSFYLQKKLIEKCGDKNCNTNIEDK